MPSDETGDKFTISKHTNPYFFQDTNLLPTDATPLSIPEVDLGRFYEDVKNEFFQPVTALLELAPKKLPETVAITGQPKGFYSTSERIAQGKENLYVYLTKQINPKELIIEGKSLGKETGFITITDSGNHEVSFHILEDNRVAFTDDQSEIGVVLDTPASLVETLRQRRRGNVGNAATWIAKLIRIGALNKLREKLEQLPDKR